MDKKPMHLGLHSGAPPYTSEEAVREQLRQMPKASQPCVATRLAQRDAERKAAKNEEPWHGLHSGLPPYTSEEAVQEQLQQAPRIPGPSIATRLIERGKAAGSSQTADVGDEDQT